ncbi:MAG: hypothetical protein H0V36_09310 [Chloroflexi bacterium]|nr:hypothetical protein [Chloroflexota bacterium]
MPAGHAFGLPLGITFMGSAWSEPRLIGLASGFEAVTQARRKPTFRETVGSTTNEMSPLVASRALRRPTRAPVVTGL